MLQLLLPVFKESIVAYCDYRWFLPKVIANMSLQSSVCFVLLFSAAAEFWITGLQSHKELVAGVLELASSVQHDKQLTALIRRKFAIKCTTGYSLNALVDFSLDDPIEIIKRLMIGSEGTFGFVSQATYNCVPEWPHKVGSSSIPTLYLLLLVSSLASDVSLMQRFYVDSAGFCCWRIFDCASLHKACMPPG